MDRAADRMIGSVCYHQTAPPPTHPEAHRDSMIAAHVQQRIEQLAAQLTNLRGYL